jgi:hypothetical protein
MAVLRFVIVSWGLTGVRYISISRLFRMYQKRERRERISQAQILQTGGERIYRSQVCRPGRHSLSQAQGQGLWVSAKRQWQDWVPGEVREGGTESRCREVIVPWCLSYAGCLQVGCLETLLGPSFGERDRARIFSSSVLLYFLCLSDWTWIFKKSIAPWCFLEECAHWSSTSRGQAAYTAGGQRPPAMAPNLGCPWP